MGGPRESGRARVTLTVFGAPWCVPYLLLSGALDRIETAGWQVRRVDTETEVALAEEHRIIALPTFTVLLDGQECSRMIGAVSEQDLQAALDKAARRGSRH